MKIKKMYQGTVPENKILDTYSTSATDTYSCNYINPVVLYENASTGETGTVTLSDSSANYFRIDIECLIDDKYFINTVYNPNGKTIPLSCVYLTSANQMQTTDENISISGNSITRGTRIYVNVEASGALNRGTSSTAMSIIKVIGYK